MQITKRRLRSDTTHPLDGSSPYPVTVNPNEASAGLRAPEVDVYAQLRRSLTSAAAASLRSDPNGSDAERPGLWDVSPANVPLAQAAGADLDPPSSVLGNLIGDGEGGYGSYNRGNAGDTNGAQIDLSQLTVGDVMRRQRLPGSDPDYVFAVGKYQFVPDTLEETVNALGIDRDQPFTPELQERMFADYLIDGKRPQVNAYITGQSDDLAAAQLALAQEFASVADPRTGRSYYDGVGNNSASITAAQAEDALNQMRAQYQANLAQGLSPDAAYDALRSASGAPNPTEPEGVPEAGLARGQSGAAVQALQDRLVDFGVMSPQEQATGPGIFGERTEQRVKDFQSAVDLSPSGVFDNATQAAMRAIHGGVGVDRNPNADVTRALHEALVESEHMTQAQVDAENGAFGAVTEEALKAWQADNDVQPTGILGPTTFQAIRGAAGSGSWPVPGHFTINRADKPGEGEGEFGEYRSGGRSHNGIDINAPVGSPVESFRAGEVAFAGEMRGFGTTVIVQHDNGLQTVYAHLGRIDVRQGQRVTEDTQLGTIGRSGNVPPAGDAHLHFEIREGASGLLTGTPVDPRNYLQFP